MAIDRNLGREFRESIGQVNATAFWLRQFMYRSDVGRQIDDATMKIKEGLSILREVAETLSPTCAYCGEEVEGTGQMHDKCRAMKDAAYDASQERLVEAEERALHEDYPGGYEDDE